MVKSKYFEKAVAIIMVAMLCLIAVPQVLVAAEPAYALNGTIGSLTTLAGDYVTWSGQTSGSIKIQLTAAAGGAEFSAYKLLDIAKNGDGRLVVTVPDSAQDFWKAYIDTSETVTVPRIKEKLADYGTDSEKSSSIVNKFLGFSGTKPTPTDTVTVAGTSATITPDSFGFYIIQQTKAPSGGYIASAPVLACLPMQKVAGTGPWLSSYTVVPKDDTIDITKKVKVAGAADYGTETIAEIGDTLNYEIVADLAIYGSDITKGEITYTLEDKLPDAIEYNGGAVVEFYNTKNSAYETVSGYTVDYDSANKKLSVILGTNYATKFVDYDKVKITYTAKFNQSANIVIEGAGNANTATLTYTSAVGQTQSIESTAKAYTLELDVTKVEKGNTSNHLEGAVFQVYRTQADANNSTNVIQFIDISTSKGDGNKHYRVATAEEIADEGITKITDITVSNDPSNIGKMNIYGLNKQNYYFKEIVAPVGYNIPDELFNIAVKPESFVNETNHGDYDATGIKLSFNDTHQSESIENDSGINLPVTGGMGTILFTAIGLLLMAGAVYFLFGKKKGSH